MDHREYCGALATQVERFTGLIADADLTTPVPACPGWDLAQLVRHVGATQRWVHALVAAGDLDKRPYEPFIQQAPADSAVLPVWLADGAGDLFAVLAATPPDRPVWTWTSDHCVGAWPRRMLHEVALHFADAAVARGVPTMVEARLAEDGIDEYLTNIPHLAEADGVKPLELDGPSLALVATDTGTTWWIDCGRQPPSVYRRESPDGAGAVVSAPAERLYLYVWGRLNLERHH
jgi:uncharacterized protein (TIGR03083 family)